MSKVNNIEVFRRADGYWDFRIIANENGNTLCSSSQGYVDKDEAMQIGTRVVAGLLGSATFTQVKVVE